MTAPATCSPIPPIGDAPSTPASPGTLTATESASRPNPLHPATGTSPGLRLDTAITLPVGVEAYAAYALRA